MLRMRFQGCCPAAVVSIKGIDIDSCAPVTHVTGCSCPATALLLPLPLWWRRHHSHHAIASVVSSDTRCRPDAAAEPALHGGGL